MLRGRTLAIGFLAAAALRAAGHDLWVERDGKGYLLQGHRHSAHGGAEIAPYAPSAVKTVLCTDITSATHRLAAGTAYAVKVDTDCAAVLVDFSCGYRTQTAWATRNEAKTGISGVVRS